MRIAILITGLGVGGAERLVVDLADRLVLLGHTVLIIYLAGEADVRPRDPRVVLFGTRMGRSRGGVIKGFFAARRALKRFRPDVVHSHLVHANLVARILRLTMYIPRLICSAHNTNEEGWGRMAAYRFTDWLADISTNVSDEAVSVFVAQGAVRPGRMITLVNGIDVGKFKFVKSARDELRRELLANSTVLVLAVGRLCEAKDYPNLINAFTRVRSQSGNVKLAIVGAGTLRPRLEALVVSLNLEAHVMFLGVRYDIAELMSACDVFVLSSAWEGFGLVVAEAMACGSLVVATDSGGVREVLGDTGVLVPPGNSDELARAILRALAMPPEVVADMTRRARQRVEELYSLDVTVERWIGLYRSELARAA